MSDLSTGDTPRTYPFRPIVAVGAVVMLDDGVVLVNRRNEPLAGRWTLPGGTLEVGETLEQGVIREVHEETGLQVEVGPVIKVFDRIERDHEDRVRFHYVIVDYACRATGGALRAGSDAGEVVVVPQDRLGEFALTTLALDVIDRGLALLRDPVLGGAER
jgi:8-oxo-dGTP diphosphatase